MAKKEEQITEEVVAVDIKRFIVEDFDKFNDKKTAKLKWPGKISSRYYYNWFNKGDSTVTDYIGFEFYFTMRYVKTPDIESVLIDYHYIGNDWLFIKDKEMTINLDGGKNIKLKSHESDTNVGVGFRNGVEEIGFYQITKKQLKQICDAKEVEVLIQASKGRHYLKNEETKGCTGGMTPSVKFLFMCRAFYSGLYEDDSYSEYLETAVPPGTENETASSSGCFIATAALGSYDHPLVLDLRNFRDGWISEKSWGQEFIDNYYRYSPRYANIIEKHRILKLISYLLIVKPLHIFSKIIGKK